MTAKLIKYKQIILFPVLLWIIPIHLSAQTDSVVTINYAIDSVVIPTEDFVFESPWTAKGALKDIASGNIKLIVETGMFPFEVTKKDTLFQLKYNLNYEYNGCVHIGNEDREAYNKEMAKYLDKKYGVKWRDEVNESVSGLDDC